MKHCESGRSLVEMLGTLAIMGLIGITGLQGFTYAMKRHRANELLNEANKRAIMVATDLMTGKKPEDISITGFPENSYGTFKAQIEPEGNDKFKMTVTGLEEGTCELLDSLAKGPIRRINCKEESSAEIFFNNDLSTEERASDYNTPETCQPPFKWCSGSNTCTSEESCTCSGTKPACKVCDTATGEYSTDEDDDTPCKTDPTLTEEDGTCQSGECVEIPVGPTCSYTGAGIAGTTIDGVSYSGGYAGKASDGITECNCPAGQVYKEDGCGQQPTSCSDWTKNECGTGYYCYFNDYTTYTNDEVYYGAVTGICARVSTPTEINVKLSATETKKLYRYDGNKNWWTAASLCNTQHNGLIIPSDVGFSSGNTSGGTDKCAGDTSSGYDIVIPACTINCACGKHNTTVCPGANSSIGCSSKGALCNCWKYLNRSSLLGKHYYWTQNSAQYDTENSRHVFVVGLYGDNIGGVVEAQREAFDNMYTLCK